MTPSDMALEDRNGEVRGNAEDLPNPDALPALRIYEHSSLFYWWPVWLVGYLFAILTWFKGGYVELDEVRRELFHEGAEIGLIYVLILTFVILFTNFRLRGIYSVAFLLAIGLIITLIALAGWWDEILSYIPYLSIHMNMGFYVVFSTILFIAWLLSFFVFDRLVYYIVRPGQLIRISRIGGDEETWDSRGMLVEERADDYFRHYVLGLGSGDLTLNTSGAKSEEIRLYNVLLANRKMKIIQRLVAVEPNRLMQEPQ